MRFWGFACNHSRFACCRDAVPIGSFALPVEPRRSTREVSGKPRQWLKRNTYGLVFVQLRQMCHRLSDAHTCPTCYIRMVVTKAASRKVSKERTRNKLIQATLRVLHKNGASALTTRRITKEAELAQPTFYVHFQDMDDALTHAAQNTTTLLLPKLRELRAPRADNALEGVRGMVTDTLDALVAERRVLELFLRHRNDVDTPLGQHFRDVEARGLAEFAQDLRAAGITEEVLPGLELHCEAFLAGLTSMALAVVERRVERQAAIEAISGMAYSVFVMGPKMRREGNAPDFSERAAPPKTLVPPPQAFGDEVGTDVRSVVGSDSAEQVG